MPDPRLVDDAERLGLELLPVAERGTSGRVNRDLVAALGAAGLFEQLFAEDVVTATDLCQVRQGLARSSTEAEAAFAVQGLGGVPIHLFGSETMKARWMPGIRSGAAVAAFALTEPGVGSDAANLAMTAERDGDGYRLTGEKTYISNAPDADVAAVFARTTPGAGSRGVTAFAVPIELDGVSGSTIEMISPHPLGRWVFDGALVPAESVLGEVDHGFRVAMTTLDLFRPSVGALAVGMAEAALRIAVDHAASREAFGSPISEFQGVSHQLADVRVGIEAASHLVYSAAATYDSGDQEALTARSAMAKLAATETAQKAVDVAIQVLGARGLEADSTLAHLYKEVRAPRIYEGTSEIQRNIIARELFRGRI
ncbi:MAG TPA: acyl-CoA dehydrogenase family protein [Acidimicrobiia bacterium]